jgi:hypothetical protein
MDNSISAGPTYTISAPLAEDPPAVQTQTTVGGTGVETKETWDPAKTVLPKDIWEHQQRFNAAVEALDSHVTALCEQKDAEIAGRKALQPTTEFRQLAGVIASGVPQEPKQSKKDAEAQAGAQKALQSASAKIDQIVTRAKSVDLSEAEQAALKSATKTMMAASRFLSGPDKNQPWTVAASARNENLIDKAAFQATANIQDPARRQAVLDTLRQGLSEAGTEAPAKR